VLQTTVGVYGFVIPGNGSRYRPIARFFKFIDDKRIAVIRLGFEDASESSLLVIFDNGEKVIPLVLDHYGAVVGDQFGDE
jgi:hypothetical protein